MKIKIKFSFLTLMMSIGMNNLQAQSLRNDMISTIGGSYHLETSNLIIHQSIGQSSVSGLLINTPTILSQGFLRGIQHLQPTKKEPWEVITYPNSFSSLITFKFLQDQKEETIFTIYDLNGKMVFDQPMVPINNEVELNLDHLTAGLYLTLIQDGNKIIQKRILKSN